MSVEQRVKQIIVEQLGVDEGQVDNNASFVDDLGADSLDIVELVMAFEEAFDIDIPDEDAEKIATVKDAIDYIENKKKKYAAGSPSGAIVVAQSSSHRSRLAEPAWHWHRRELESHPRGAERDFQNRTI